MQVYLFIALVCLIIMGVFIFQNPTMVVVQFLGWHSPEVQLGIIVLMAVITGAFITFMLDTFRYFKIAKTIRELRASNKKLEKMNQALQSSAGHTQAAESEAEAAAVTEQQE
jgi:uncharacterized integral membrane protein